MQEIEKQIHPLSLSVILSLCLLFILKQQQNWSVITIGKITRNKIIAIFLIVVFISSFTSLIIWLKSIFPKGKIVTVSFEYTDDCLLGIDSPVVGLEIKIYVDSTLISLLYTDVNGEVFFAIDQMGNYQYTYYWKNAGTGMHQVDESESATYYEVLDCHEIDPIFMWADDLSLASDMQFDLMYYDGTAWVLLTTIQTNSMGKMFAPLEEIKEE